MTLSFQLDSNRRFTAIEALGNLLLGLFFLFTSSACQKIPDFSYNFEEEKDVEKITWKCGTVLSLTDHFVTSGEKSLQVEMYPPDSGSQNKYPGVYFMHFNGDWSLKNNLLLDITNPEEQPLTLIIKIDDAKNLPYADRYNGEFQLKPGSNHISLPFKNLITTKTRRLLNIRSIISVKLFLEDPSKNHTLYFDNFRLE